MTFALQPLVPPPTPVIPRFMRGTEAGMKDEAGAGSAWVPRTGRGMTDLFDLARGEIGER